VFDTVAVSSYQIFRKVQYTMRYTPRNRPIHQVGTARQLARARSSANLLYLVLLIAALIQFTTFWLYGESTKFGDPLINSKAYGIPYQYALWTSIIIATGNEVYLGVGLRILNGAWPLIPFWVAGVLASIDGWDPAASLRILLFWLAMAVCAGTVAHHLEPRKLRVTVAWTLFIMLAFSAAYSLLFPSMGQEMYGTQPVWRGAFVGKNQLGWVASFGLIFAARLKDLRPAARIILGAVSLACLVKSGSATALVAAVVAFGYGVAITTIKWMRLPSGLARFLVVSAAAAIALIVPIVVATSLSWLGRDATLTGRTIVWDIYLDAMHVCGGFGCGAGAFTSENYLTEPLAASLVRYGEIYSPHNMFIGAYGEGGLLGLVALVCGLGYITFIEPFRSKVSQASEQCAILGMLIIVGGITETRDLYAAGIGPFVLMLWRIAAARETTSRKLAVTDRGVR
jgi:O-antigen ligase